MHLAVVLACLAALLWPLWQCVLHNRNAPILREPTLPPKCPRMQQWLHIQRKAVFGAKAQRPLLLLTSVDAISCKPRVTDSFMRCFDDDQHYACTSSNAPHQTHARAGGVRKKLVQRHHHNCLYRQLHVFLQRGQFACIHISSCKANCEQRLTSNHSSKVQPRYQDWMITHGINT